MLHLAPIQPCFDSTLDYPSPQQVLRSLLVNVCLAVQLYTTNLRQLISLGYILDLIVVDWFQRTASHRTNINIDNQLW